jgi:2-polyprenyl-3-methyl-5-hydroxy-6-metoxy-1,4-benzoquinol methylase
MPKADWQANPVQKIFEAHYPHGLVQSVLDVGCGLSMQSQYIPAEVRVGVDLHRPYLEAARAQSGIGHTFVLIEGNVLDIGKLFLPQSFDLVICLDVVEHITKEDGFHLLTLCEKIAREAVCVVTPLGDMPQNLDILGFGAHELQTHRSAWVEDDFIARGYHVHTYPYRTSGVKRHTVEPAVLDITKIAAIKRMRP